MISNAKRIELFSEIRKASQELKKGRSESAVALYENVAQQAESDVQLHIGMGQLCREFENYTLVIKHYELALQGEPDNEACLTALGLAYLDKKKFEKAEETLLRAIAINENNALIHGALGEISMSQTDYEQAKVHLERSRHLKPNNFAVLCHLALTLNHLGEPENALGHIRKAIKLSPTRTEGYSIQGLLLTVLGKLDEAVASLEMAIRYDAASGDAYDSLARARKFSVKDLPFMRKIEKRLLEAMPAKQRSNIHFALGKMYDDCKDWDVAFEHYRHANLIGKRDFDYSKKQKLFSQIARAFDRTYIRNIQLLGNQTDVPVFIVGMPRSGTTLMEQIIASHPEAAGAGELNYIARICETIAPFDEPKQISRRIRANLDSESIEKHAQFYLGALTEGRPGARRIVDKLPSNYFFVGLIASLFPNATIIHATRDPLDTCLSCFFQNFAMVDWKFDLSEIAREYRFYRSVMKYWESVLPDGKMIEVNYEKLIEEPDAEGRRLHESCGLEWSPESLNFQKQKNAVQTASVWQVRQGMYRTSKKRWKNYAGHIGELAQELSEFLYDERDELRECGIELKRPSLLSRIERVWRG